MEEEKPADWDKTYQVQVDGKTLEAMQYLATKMLELPMAELGLPMVLIGAADCVYSWAQSVRQKDDA